MDTINLGLSPANICHVPGEFQDPVFHGSYSFNTGRIKKLTIADYAVFGILISMTFFIGVYVGWQNRKSETLNEFLMAYRLMSGVPVGISFAATFISGTSIIGTFTEIYLHGVMYSWVAVALVFLALASGFIFHPVFYRLQVITAYEYLEMRFDKTVRSIAALLYVTSVLAYNALNLCAPTVALKEVTGLSLWGSIAAIGFICITISALGGMQSIIGSDVFTLCLLFLSILVVLGRAMQVTDSWESVWESNKRSHMLVFDEIRLEPGIRHSVWSVIIGCLCAGLGFIATSQQLVQKTIACNQLKDVKIAILIGCFMYMAVAVLLILLALYIGAFYENCDPVQSRIVLSGTEVLPLFVIDALSDTYGMVGMFSAGLLLASLSTSSSGINAVSTVVMEDFLMSYSSSHMTASQARRMATIIGIVYGLLVLLGTYIAAHLQNILQAAFLIHGLLLASVFGVFALGMFFPWANTKGAVSGMLGSEAVMVIIYLTTTLSDEADIKPLRCTSNCNPHVFGNITVKDAVMSKKYQLSYLWYSPLNIFLCVLIGLVVSLATGPENPPDLDRNLCILVCDEIFPFFYLPETFRKRFRPSYLKHKNRQMSVGMFLEQSETDIQSGQISVRNSSERSETDIQQMQITLGTFSNPSDTELQTQKPVKTDSGKAPTSAGQIAEMSPVGPTVDLSKQSKMDTTLM